MCRQWLRLERAETGSKSCTQRAKTQNWLINEIEHEMKTKTWIKQWMCGTCTVCIQFLATSCISILELRLVQREKFVSDLMSLISLFFESPYLIGEKGETTLHTVVDVLTNNSMYERVFSNPTKSFSAGNIFQWFNVSDFRQVTKTNTIRSLFLILFVSHDSLHLRLWSKTCRLQIRYGRCHDKYPLKI